VYTKSIKRAGGAILDIKYIHDRKSIEIFKELNWLPVDERANYFRAILMF
jgi:hypothetical protein